MNEGSLIFWLSVFQHHESTVREKYPSLCRYENLVDFLKVRNEYDVERLAMDWGFSYDFSPTEQRRLKGLTSDPGVILLDEEEFHELENRDKITWAEVPVGVTFLTNPTIYSLSPRRSVKICRLRKKVSAHAYKIMGTGFEYPVLDYSWKNPFICKVFESRSDMSVIDFDE